MSMESKYGESGAKPFELILRVRSSVIELARQYMRALQNLPQSGDKTQLHKEWHVAVMSYWREISRFRFRDNITDTWNEDIQDLGFSLEDIRVKQLDMGVEQVTKYNPDINNYKTQSETRATVFEPGELIRITDRLDLAAHQLGFDATPQRNVNTYGWIDEPIESDT
jgi:hypothetical protein